MTETPHDDTASRHRSARERQRRGPMWGCLKTLVLAIGGFALLLTLLITAGWLYIGSTSFAGLVRLRIERTLEARLGRNVSIGKVTVVRSRPQKVILDDIRIANAPGGTHPYFATVRQLEITGGIDSFWGRRIRVGRVDIRDPRLNYEVFPKGSPLEHNFPKWQAPKRGKYEIYRLDLGTLFVTGGTFDFLDRRHDIAAVVSDLSSQVNVTYAEGVYQGTIVSPLVRTQIQDFLPFDMNLRGGFRYAPNQLELQSIALRGRDMDFFVSGNVAPLSEAAYDLQLRSQLGLNRVREIFKVEKTLEGRLSLDTRLRGKAGTFTLAGDWVSPLIRADVYDIGNAKGKLSVTDQRAVIDVASGSYGGGSIAAHYELPGYAEPYPMSIDLRYTGVSLEKLFADWGLTETGLRGGATGQLSYGWNKDDVLNGSGTGSATLARSTVAFTDAEYPIPLAGSADFDLERGVIRFRNAVLQTEASKIDFAGTMRIEDLASDLQLSIASSDFSELDRVAYNFAHSTGKTTYTLLGLGGSGTMTGRVVGPLKTSQVTAQITGSGTKYNNVLLGESEIDLTYDGVRSVLTFEKATFRHEGGVLSMTGTLTFPERGPSPVFDLAIDVTNFSVEQAIAIVDLPLKGIRGRGTGKLIVTGTPEDGRVRFATLNIRRSESDLRLNGDVAWRPGEGNVEFDLDIAATSFPVADIAEFLDLGTLPVSGDLTGTLHLEGPKSKLDGAGSVTVRNGAIFGEPIDVATADIAFAQGRLRATNITVKAPAGEITAEAEYDLGTEEFSYIIRSSSINLARLKVLGTLAELFGGTLVLTSSGGGTFDRPELVVEATLNQATVRGLALPEGSAPPSLYLAIRNGQLIVKGNLADALIIDGSGTVGPELTVDGTISIRAPNIERLLSMSPATAAFPATGRLEATLRLGGRLSPVEALRADLTFPLFEVRLSGQDFAAARPIRLSLRDGRLTFDDFEIRHPDTSLVVTGYASIVGDKRLAVNVRGSVEAAILQLFVDELRADGHINVAAAIGGRLDNPRITGTAEIQDAQFRVPGFPQMIDDVTGTLVFHGDRIEVDSLRASIGGGTVIAGGSISVDGLTPQRVRLSIQGTNVAIRYFEGLTIDGDFDLLLTGDLDRMALQGDIAVNRALYFRDFDFATAFLNVVLSRRGITPIVAAGWQDHVDLRLHIRAPGTIAVRNNIAEVTGSGEIDVSGTLANPVVLGVVTLDEGGSLRLQNIDYRVVRGTINFQNPFRIDPYFDITVEGRISGGGFASELESGPVDITINLTGTIDRFTPTITSDPPASDITLFSILGFGGLTSPTGSPNASAGNIGTSLLYRGLSGFLGNRILPFADTFTIDPGLLDTSSDPGTKVTIEKRVSNSIRVLVIYNLQRAHSRALVEWQVNPDWTIQLTRDELRKEYRAEARFRRRYQGHWTWGGRGKPVTMFASTRPGTGNAAANAAEPLPEGVPEAPGPNVVAVAARSDAPIDTAALMQHISVRAGRPLSVRQVQSSIKTLFATGDFRDVRVDSTPTTGGVTVTFILSLNYRVTSIRFDGVQGADRDRANRELTVRIGDVLSFNAVDKSAIAVQQFLNRGGYLEATVDPETVSNRAESRADVIFHVTPGPRATVGSVTIDGNVAPFSNAELIGEMRNGPGDTFLVSQARTDAERMERFMIRRDHRRAQVRYAGETYDRETRTVALRYTASAGPRVRVEVEGVPRRAVRRLIPFGRNQGYSEDVIDTAAERIVEHYQSRGFYNATVDTESSLVNREWVTTFKVQPGQQFRLTGVTFTGNRTLPDRELAAVIQTAPAGGFRSLIARLFRRPTGTTRTQLNDDLDAIEATYRLNGFSEATVATPVVTTDAATGSMTVDFTVTEGPQTIVTAVNVEGNEQIPLSELPELLLKPGEPLNPQLLRTDLVTLQSFYADRGNAEAQVTPRPDVSADKTSAAITYVIAEGPRITLGDVAVRGNTYTDSDVVLRTADLRKGEAFSYTRILEAQRDLYRLGIFQRVDIQPEQTGTSVSDRNVAIQVEEGKNLTLAGSVGATKQSGTEFSPLGSVSIAHRNLFGSGRYLGLELIGSREREEAFLTYREPFIGRWNIPVQLNIFQSEERRPHAHIIQRGTSIEASKVARLQTRWSLRYEYRIGDCVVSNPNDPTDLCAQAEQAIVPGVDSSITDITISSITPTFFWDRRDDPIDPHRGFFTTAVIEYAFPLFAAEAHFLKEFAQASYYFPVSERTVFAVSSRIGFIQAIGSIEVDGRRIPRPVPFTERFVGGGANSHRAFQLDLLGSLCNPTPEGCDGTLIRLLDPQTGQRTGSIAPIGGNAIFLTNMEYRFPIFSTVGGSVFTDFGNTYPESNIRLNQMRWGVGAGIRYLSPIGPLRFDIGYKLRRQAHEKPFAYFITVGYAF